MVEDICCRKCNHSELTFDENSDEVWLCKYNLTPKSDDCKKCVELRIE